MKFENSQFQKFQKYICNFFKDFLYRFQIYLKHRCQNCQSNHWQLPRHLSPYRNQDRFDKIKKLLK
jgi:hypothetical protein